MKAWEGLNFSLKLGDSSEKRVLMACNFQPPVYFRFP